MSKWPGIGDRIRERLKVVGYWKADKPDVLRFSVERGYIATYVYKWLSDTTPSRANLYKLARDLGASPGWLLLGDDIPEEAPRRGRKPRRPVPIAGGSAQAEPRPAGSGPDQVRLIGSYAARQHVRVTAAAAGFRRRLAARAA